ncbi:c-type cytochrome biogenesis protein CcsB [Psychromicrobium xiongbiense]|uniref:c-type cytochrome biogenesis protein CcsB n=1 Tax=Psychromicrobium xiongbiense TaxID=3051184 RepID=UPI0025523EBF|nr:c-type cytochrome biogenesis protein CcsB [Psychromicrobium sp. YIM S02556]
MPVINVALGQYGELFLLLAGITYSVAFCAFTWDLVSSSRLTRSLAAQSAQDQAARDQAGQDQQFQGQAARERQLVSAAVTAGSSADDARGNDAGAGDSRVNGVTSGLAERPLSNSGSGTVLEADESMKYVGARRPAARIGVSITLLAVLLHGAAVVLRGLAAGRVPWGNMFEFCTTGSFLVAAVFLIVLTRRDLRFLGTFVIGLVLVMLFAASSAFYVPAAHLVPALQSYWLVIHVSIAVLSSAIFTLTFAMGVLQLVQTWRSRSLAQGKPDKLPFMRLVPSALSLENLSYRLNALAFVGWTLTLIFGAMWAEKAWGRYWGWDTKEVWTFVIWVVYAGYLHARATRGWTGTRAAVLSITGYLCVIVNFTLVNTVFQGLHSYSGV